MHAYDCNNCNQKPKIMVYFNTILNFTLPLSCNNTKKPHTLVWLTKYWGINIYRYDKLQSPGLWLSELENRINNQWVFWWTKLTNWSSNYLFLYFCGNWVNYLNSRLKLIIYTPVTVKLRWSLWSYAGHCEMTLVTVKISWLLWIYAGHCGVTQVTVKLHWSLWSYAGHCGVMPVKRPHLQ